MSTIRIGLLVSALALATGACLVRGRVSGGVVATSDPVLVELYPGVWVIEDYNEPVFYADGYYWLYRDDGWFRSTHHTRGWVRVGTVPQPVVRIEQPRAYVHYRAAPGVRVRTGPRGQVIVRDHRDKQSRDKRDKHDRR